MIDRPVPASAASARRRILAGERALVPDLWRCEIANAVVVAERRGRISPSQVAAVSADFEAFAQTIEIDSSAGIGVLIETARRTGLTAYDAAYLELALRRRVPLATLDDELRAAARRAGIEVI
jgi:predicted nucleic acid-binding protein